MPNVVTWRHLVNWSWMLGVLPHLLGTPATIMGGYNLAMLHAGKAPNTSMNLVVTWGLLIIGVLLMLLGIVATWRATSSIDPVQATRQRALSMFAATSLNDPVSMDLIQRLARAGQPTEGTSAVLANAPVAELLQAIELRLSKDIAERLIGKVQA